MRKHLLLAVIDVAAATLLATATFASAGLEWTDKEGSLTYMERGVIKNVSSDGGGMWTIFDANKDTMTIVSDRRKTYATGAPETFCQEIKQMQEKMMAGMPPETRAMMEQMMAQQKEKAKRPSVTVKKIDGGDTVAGYKTVFYNVYVDKKFYGEVHLATDPSLLEEAGDLGAMMEMSDRMDACMGMWGMGEFDPAESPEYNALHKIGIPMKEIMNGEVQLEVVKLEKKKLPASVFKVPGDYRKVSFADLFMKMGPHGQ